ncbi:MAG: type II toxin-antitoxin system Phd/YefM family antitoxin [Deltaproteobacteria bacterium]|nr:type II toxin-antitoxin system Phd/YefM family antitoxin [Deltaproteobacteria bacterium]
MKRRSLVEVKAHLSEIVDQAEHRGASVLILRHGKPAAAIVPVGDVVVTPTKRPRRPTRRELEAILEGLGKARPGASAVEELLRDRR